MTIMSNLQHTDQCTSGFPDVASREGNGRGDSSNVVTRLFPDMRFGCGGTIVRLTVAGRVVNRQQNPKIQVWRENKTQSDVYFKPGSDIILERFTSCDRNRLPQIPSGSGVYHCTLTEAAQVSVQPGDILGLELPPTSSHSFEIYFTSGGPMNYVFQRQLFSTVDLSERVFVTKDLPQISLLVVLGNNMRHSNDFALT